MFRRNLGYVPDETQKKLSEIKVLFAGCGVGSAVAEPAARLGVKNFTLIDGDTIEIHNLNRQSFEYADIGASKVESLKKRILKINPEAKVNALFENVTLENVEELVKNCDVVFDTIDFLDLSAIVHLHDMANKHSKPIISLFTAGFGAVAIYVKPEQRSRSWIRELFQLPDGDLKNESYTGHFFKFFERLAGHLNPQVQHTMNEVFQKMKDNKPCPAPHVVAGALSAGALGTHILTKYLNGEEIKSAPDFIYLDLHDVESRMSFRI
jgi:molybdopterin/thiamine biosynthesis adenylyltransferase